jgi:hypothetical protein
VDIGACVCVCVCLCVRVSKGRGRGDPRTATLSVRLSGNGRTIIILAVSRSHVAATSATRSYDLSGRSGVTHRVSEEVSDREID